MTGDAEAILRLYREMLGEIPEQDLSDVWAVQLGIATEQLNADWFERKNRMEVTRRGEVVVHPRHGWAACTIDGWIEELGCPIELKHTGGREPFETIVDRYTASISNGVTTASQCALFVIVRQPAHVNTSARGPTSQILHRGAQFMDCVARRIVPVHLAMPGRSSPQDL